MDRLLLGHVVAGFSPRLSTMGTKHHRLPRECYQGRVSAAFTICADERKPLFVETTIVRVFAEFLEEVAEKHFFKAIFCFMPDHLHLICMAKDDNADLLSGIEEFKQRTGFWLASNLPQVQWEKSFHDRIIRCTEELAANIRYVLDNPVRGGLVTDWRDYPYTGAIGLDLPTFLEELSPY